MKSKKRFSPNPWILPVATMIFILIATIVLVAFAQGYRINPRSSQIEKTGLVLIDSEPGDATISINKTQLDKKTPFRYTDAPIGSITVGLQKPDYRDWQATSDVRPSEVTFLNYALLLPNILRQNSLSQPKAYVQVLPASDSTRVVALSQDRRSIYSLSPDGKSQLIYQLTPFQNQPNPPVAINLVELSTDGSRLLFRQTSQDGTSQVFVVQVSDGRAQNASTIFGVVLTDIRFNPRNSTELFWLETGVVKKLGLNNGSISAPLVSNVSSLSLAKDRMLVITSPSPQKPLEQQLISYDLSGKQQKVVRNLPTDPLGYQTTYISSRYAEYIAIVSNSTKTFTLIEDPYGANKLAKTIAAVTNITVNPNQRFIVLSAGNLLTTLDLELDRETISQTSLAGLSSWSWYDTHHLLVLQSSQVRLIDYDGQNNQLLAPTSDLIGAYPQKDKKAVFPLNSKGELFELFLTKK